MSASAPPSDSPKQHPIRFFVALIPPPEVQARATALKEDFRDRFRSKAALRSPPHITLQAPFEWPKEDQHRLLSTLADFTSSHSTVPITLSGFGAFPPRVIYLAVQHTPELMALQAELSQYLNDTLGIYDRRSRDRPFRPHLTVAFRDLKPAAFRRAWPEFEHRELEFSFTTESITLLKHTGQRWNVHKTFPISPATPSD